MTRLSRHFGGINRIFRSRVRTAEIQPCVPLDFENGLDPFSVSFDASLPAGGKNQSLTSRRDNHYNHSIPRLTIQKIRTVVSVVRRESLFCHDEYFGRTLFRIANCGSSSAKEASGKIRRMRRTNRRPKSAREHAGELEKAREHAQYSFDSSPFLPFYSLVEATFTGTSTTPEFEHVGIGDLWSGAATGRNFVTARSRRCPHGLPDRSQGPSHALCTGTGSAVGNAPQGSSRGGSSTAGCERKGAPGRSLSGRRASQTRRTQQDDGGVRQTQRPRERKWSFEGVGVHQTRTSSAIIPG